MSTLDICYILLQAAEIAIKADDRKTASGLIAKVVALTAGVIPEDK